ncbi:MAG: FAD-binding protein, partial [Firmicutes bacterium]|nr:FAD-binding protein [Bacillota bacterium]
MKNYDVVIIGAGSVGLPLAHSLGLRGLKVVVVDKLSSV